MSNIPSGNPPPENPLYSLLREHIGHEVVVVCYGKDGEDSVNVSVECEDCGCVLVDADQYSED